MQDARFLSGLLDHDGALGHEGGSEISAPSNEAIDDRQPRADPSRA
jgi:hypothetical protein